MRIEVTQEDINEGRRGRCYRCPVARAIQRVLLPKYTAAVYPDTIEIKTEKGLARVIELHSPESVVTFVKSFDYGHVATPFSFDLPIPTEYLKEQS